MVVFGMAIIQFKDDDSMNTPLGLTHSEKAYHRTIENLIIGKYWILIETHCGIGLQLLRRSPIALSLQKNWTL